MTTMAKPRARAPTQPLDSLLRRLEIPDCGCVRLVASLGLLALHLSAPCRHVLAADHRLTLAEWTGLLESAYPDDYREPPAPPRPDSAISQPARAAMMASRHDQGFGLYHPLDAIMPLDGLGRVLGLAGNGRPFELQLVPLTMECDLDACEDEDEFRDNAIGW